MNDIVIKAHNLSKKYHLYNDPIDRLKEALHPLRKKYFHDFYALKDLNFEIKKGETIGIIGKNGSGKSTLLKILTGVLTPSAGSYRVKGKISSLLELGAGFNPELSGLENVYFNATILGRTKKEIDSQLDEILKFADIGDFIHQPVKTYSSGMAVRLAFAVAVNVDPDILIIDEALAVGDMTFQKKCMEKIDNFKESGKTIIFCSHDMHAVNALCDRAIWLKDGMIADIGKSEVVISSYVSWMTNIANTYVVENKNKNFCCENSDEVQIDSFKLFDLNANKKLVFFTGEDLFFEVIYTAKYAIKDPSYSLLILKNEGMPVAISKSLYNKKFKNEGLINGEHKIVFVLKNVQLTPGKYYPGISIWDKSTKIRFALNRTIEFEIKSGNVVFGPMEERTIFFPCVEWQ